MAVATCRHSENIEVQDEDQGDTIYENETTVTARRPNVEMSEEGHYERLDLQKIDDAVYGDLRTKKKQSGRRPFQVVAGGLGMLCLMLLGVVIAQAHYHNQLILMGDRLKTDHAKVTLERDQLNASYFNLTLERDQLNASYFNLTLEHGQLKNKSCLSGWTTIADSCYYRTTGVKTWQEGREECRNLGADLAVINSREEQVFIRGLNPEGPYASWIGLIRTEGGWTWVDRTTLTTEYWGNGSPHNDGDSNCAVYNHRTDSGTWFNVGCSGTASSICETK